MHPLSITQTSQDAQDTHEKFERAKYCEEVLSILSWSLKQLLVLAEGKYNQGCMASHYHCYAYL